jgi:hypothetical protein
MLMVLSFGLRVVLVPSAQKQKNGPTPRLFLAWSTLNHVTGIHISPAFLIVALPRLDFGAYTVNDSANRRIMKLGPDELMGGIGYVLQIYSSPERSRSGGRFRSRGAPERLQTGQHHHPSISLFQQIQTPRWLRGCRLRWQVSLGNHRISRQKFGALETITCQKQVMEFV